MPVYHVTCEEQHTYRTVYRIEAGSLAEAMETYWNDGEALYSSLIDHSLGKWTEIEEMPEKGKVP